MNTLFTPKALAGEDPDALRQDGCLTVNSLFEYLAEKLPETQRPVLSGVQQDTFKLACYPQFVHAKEEVEQTSKEFQREERRKENAKRLRAMFVDSSSFMHDRLNSFVGRETELTQIWQLIEEKMLTGGYVTITGQAGQGKSSIIARLVDQYIKEQGTEENVVYHFIPFNPGPDHQAGLLRDLIARLIFKYDLSELYIDYVAYGSRPALRDFFPRVLKEVMDKGKQEVLFIDGLDQLEEDFNGLRDLTFLPTDLPSGIVFVLGTRPNDTLHPLELLNPHQPYLLPNLSRSDFDGILHHRDVRLSTEIAEQFYHTMQENALFLDLVAKELMALIAGGADIKPEEMIKKLANNPGNIFSFSLNRLKRLPNWSIIEDVLGLLLTAQEPLSPQILRQILSVKEHQVRDAISRLGGLLTESTSKERVSQRRYSIFHLMFQDYLSHNEQVSQKDSFFAASEVEQYHTRLARWCEKQHLALIWQDTGDQSEQERRKYARQHYIKHLYFAKEDQWEQLFAVLDEGSYGRAKERYDLSTRSYSLDLDLGRQAAAWNGWTLDEGLEMLPLLWRYTLLRCNLHSRADQYPLETFRLLLLLKREQKALGLTELLTKLSYKVVILIEVAKHVFKEVTRKAEGVQIFSRAYQVAQLIENSYERAKALIELGAELAKVQQWERADEVWCEAERVALLLEDRYNVRAAALRALSESLVLLGQGERALRVIQQAWLLAETRDYTLKLLPLALCLISLQPEIGTGFYEAFHWVDNFLRG